MGLLRTLDTFEEEWSCRLPDIERLHLSTTVDDALQRNTVLVEATQRASEEVQRLKQELQSSHKSQVYYTQKMLCYLLILVYVYVRVCAMNTRVHHNYIGHFAKGA